VIIGVGGKRSFQGFIHTKGHTVLQQQKEEEEEQEQTKNVVGQLSITVPNSTEHYSH
jgi:hypothetical protein